ncbi:3' terminal RNA ribose 2'-O-methyltransferase Hen1 [Nocardia aurantia]|uniref:Small RNA 2'-O-methyltransferase n=1 Tax=Nocardia aurantia TaxID=2585199 RepID=A0A7K0DLD6_9NOCA|nr:3' terminal RNA ribose 2'-O-methyltransferase Hen1 [Nocardia aurantia]MQY26481.1 Ubiquinone biosynthesis O-methyltransferase [Nocardia aurantia]
MLLTITCLRPDNAAWAATDLGYLLHKHPDRAQVFDQSYGTAHVLYPEATAQRCTAALLLEIDPVRLVRGKTRGTPEFSLAQYVNDRPYAASSLLAVAISTVFSSALHGRCALRPELPDTALPLRIELPAVPCKGGPDRAERMFAPLGWSVTATPVPLDPAFPDWGDSHYLRLELTGTLRLADALNHLYVLLPVLDGGKHYWLAADEIDKLLRAGANWLPAHPERDWITRRYLARRQSLVRTALARLAEIDDAAPEELDAVDDVDTADQSDDCSAAAADSGAASPADVGPGEAGRRPLEADVAAVRSTVTRAGAAMVGTESSAAEQLSSSRSAPRADAKPADAPRSDRIRPLPADAQAAVAPPSLAVLRRRAVVSTLRAAGARRVLDLGCGEGLLLRDLLADNMFEEIVGVDVSTRALQIARRRLDRLPGALAHRIQLRQGALTYTDAALRGYDAAVLMEVIEHIDPPRLPALAHSVFGAAKPATVVVTTPNGEYNSLYEGLSAGSFRHSDHRFEWSRAEFTNWATSVARNYGYSVRFEPVGPADPELGPPTQLAVFGTSEPAAPHDAAAEEARR